MMGLLAGILASLAAGTLPPDLRPFPLDVHRFTVLERDSGPTNYYRVVEGPQGDLIRGRYEPPLESATLLADVGDAWAPPLTCDGSRKRYRCTSSPAAATHCQYLSGTYLNG
jgi:hypothetical protein